MIYITGDCHGDFGGVWNKDEESKKEDSLIGSARVGLFLRQQ